MSLPAALVGFRSPGRLRRRRHRGLRNLGLALGCALLLAACGRVHTRDATVLIKGNPAGNPDSLYEPATVGITAGQTIEWMDRDDSEHTVTPNFSYAGWSGGSGILHPGQSYSFRFLQPGVYRYHCMVHQNMNGVVVVKKR